MGDFCRQAKDRSVNLIDRISNRLAACDFRINPHDFEECATALLTRVYPGLVPISGGSDWGVDAEIEEDGRILGLIVTSSRSWDGARKSLRSSLCSMRKKPIDITEVVVANLAEINRARREKLKEIAAEFHCTLRQVYDRTWFTNQFREHPDWRQKILGIAGGPSSFSSKPQRFRPDDYQLATVGRDQLISEVSSANSDVILFGLPGTGKTHVASMIPDAVFLERFPTAERLLDDLISEHPKVVVVDDVGGRADELAMLVQQRTAENISFRIVAICWSHEIDTIADMLPHAIRLEVDLLTREEIGQILRNKGITNVAVLAQLLCRAEGRPAWALNMAELLIDKNDWESVWSGKAVRDALSNFLRGSNASEDAIDVLGTLSLLGEVTDDQLRGVARLLGLREPELMRLVRFVAVSGLVDVQEIHSPGKQQSDDVRSQRYQVRPPLVASSLAGEVFFSDKPAPVTLSDVKSQFPELAADIMQSQIYAALLGASRPVVPSPAELLKSLPTTKQDIELLQSFSQLGEEQHQLVLDIYVDRIRHSAATGNHSRVSVHMPKFTTLIARGLEAEYSGVLPKFVGILEILKHNSDAIETHTKAVVEELVGIRGGDTPSITSLMNLIERLGQIAEEDLPSEIWAEFVYHILSPVFQVSLISPESYRRLNFNIFSLSVSDLQKVFRAIRPELIRRVPHLDKFAQIRVIALLGRWVRAGTAGKLPFSGQLSELQMQEARTVAIELAKILAPTIRSPGIRAQFNTTACQLAIRIEEPDRLFAALTFIREPFQSPKDFRTARDNLLDTALAPFLEDTPDRLFKWLRIHESELQTAGVKDSAMSRVYRRLARSVPAADVPLWLNAAVANGVAKYAAPLINECARTGQLTDTIVLKLMAMPECRFLTIGEVLTYMAHSPLFNRVISHMTPSEMRAVGTRIYFPRVPDEALHALFTHKNHEVRSIAATTWASQWWIERGEVPENHDWLEAMRCFKLKKKDYMDDYERDALVALAEISPERLMDLFTKHIIEETGIERYPLSDWREPLQLLNPAERTRLWHRVKGAAQAHEAFWLIAGENQEWVAKTFSDPSFSIAPNALLYASSFQVGPRRRLETLVHLFRPLNPSPDDLLIALRSGSYTGERHERLRALLDELHQAATSEDKQLAFLAQRGIEMYEPQYKAALREVRYKEIRGE